MSTNENVDILKKAGNKFFHPFLMTILEKLISDNVNLWDNLKNEDQQKRDPKHRILDNRSRLNELDLQACQKLFYYRSEVTDQFENSFGKPFIYRIQMKTAIDCRNDYSHDDFDPESLDDVLTGQYLMNYHELMKGLAFTSDEAEKIFNEYSIYMGKNAEITIAKSYPISELAVNKLSGYSEEDIAKACVDLKISLYDDNSSLRSVDPERDISRIEKHLKSQREQLPVLSYILPPETKNFIGRKDLFEQISDRLAQKHIVILKGMGGMGKSCTAAKYANTHKEQYSTVQYVFFKKDLYHTILSMSFANLMENERSDDEKYASRLDILRRRGSSVLLVIDNMDIEFDDHFNDLMECGCDVIITSRCNILGAEDLLLPVPPLSRDEQVALFEKHYRPLNDDDERNALDELLTAIDGHTLLIELSAKTILNGDLEIRDITVCLSQDGNTSPEEFVNITKDGKASQDTLDGFIDKLYKASSIDDDEKDVLSMLALVPLSGIGRKDFQRLAGLSNNNIINGLGDKSWVMINNSQNPVLIHLHPMILKTVNNNISRTYTRYEVFLERLRDFISDEDVSRQSLTALCETAKNTVRRIPMETEEQLGAGCDLARLVNDRCSYNNACKMCGMLVDNARKLGRDRIIVRLLEIKAESETSLGRYNDAINDFSEAIDHYTDEITEYSVWYLYNRLAFVYRKKSDYDQALKYYDKTREELSKDEYKNNNARQLELATTMNDIGIVKLNQGDHENALDSYKRSLQIRENTPGAKDSDIAYSYHNIGTAYQKMGNFELAKTYHEKALEIRRERLNYPNYHPDVSASLAHIGNDYLGMGDFENAKKLYDQTLEIRLKQFGEIHPQTAWVYCNISEWYEKQGKYKYALEYMSRAVEIRRSCLGEEHIYTKNAVKKHKMLAEMLEKASV
ncbi:MAG: tetratricopeptide repeat protein [Huintestinicola sp.]|uniref:tetratricopeptide repeat protein n=1 Tax=Huintestinicola sp. TaxID=2981661 RepID=UPI003EFD82C9